MNNDFAKQVLTSPVVLLRPSSEEEQGAIFPHNSGTCYTIGLQSGQNFVAMLPGGHDTEEDNPFAMDNFAFRLRPMNNLVPQLAEIKWISVGTYGGSGVATHCEIAPGSTPQDKVFFEELFAPKAEDTSYGPRRYHAHEMFTKLNEVHNQLLENERLKLALMTGQQRLHNLMMLNDSNSANQMIQHKIDERRQNG